MRKHLNIKIAAVLLVFAVMFGNIQVFAAETNTDIIVDTITLDETLVWSENIPVDLSWKTAQDKGQWIEELGIAKEATSLILVINNLDKVDEEAFPALDGFSEKERLKQLAEHNKLDGKSRLLYFSKGTDGEWMEIFSVDCYISGGEFLEKEAVYGAYVPVSTFGSFENPGSLLPYRELEPTDYWTFDPEHESYGTIYSIDKTYQKEKNAVNLEGMKSYSNYGMILQPEDEYFACPPLIINCQQTESRNDQLSGIQMPQEKLRMMIQSIDAETRFLIADRMEDFEDM